MAKIIKRVGIVFFVLVISFLLILGCVFAVNTVKQDSDLDNNADNNVQPVASKTYNLLGSCATKYNTWQEAANYSVSNNGALVELTLKSNWIADVNSYGSSSFGASNEIVVPQGANMSLNLNGYNIDRNLSSDAQVINGYVMRIDGKFALADFDINSPYSKNFHSIATDGLTDFFGQIRGGVCYDYYGNASASAIYVSSGGHFAMHGGVICNNTLKIYHAALVSNMNSGAVFVSSGATAIFTDGAICYNTTNVSNSAEANIAAIGWNNADVALLGGLIWNNQMRGVSGIGGKLTIGRTYNNYNSLTYLYIYNNKASNGQYTVVNQDLVLTDNFTDSGLIDCGGRLIVGDYPNLKICDKRSNSAAAITSGFRTNNSSANPARIFSMSDSSLNKSFILNSNGEVIVGYLTKIAKPTRGTESNYRKTYTGGNLTYYPIGYDANTMTIMHNSFSYTGTHQAIVCLKVGYGWSDNTVDNLTFDWYIDPKPINKPTSGTNSFEYSGERQTYTPSGYDSTFMNISYNTGTNAGSYSADISLKSSNYKWSDDTYGKLTFTWTITPKPISKPTAADSNEYIFNNAEQTYIPKGYNSSTMVITGNKNTDIGEYTAKVTPNANHKWSDNTTTAIEFKYRIFPPGVVVKDGVKYDYLYIDSNNIKKSYGNSYIHRVDDQNLNLVNGISRHILGNIPINTSIETFLQNLYSDRNLIKIYAKESDITPIYDGLSGTRSNLSQTLATGFKVELYSNSTDTTPFDTIYLSVLGDINGDGRINASDVSYLRQVANDSTLLESMSLERQLACMINNKGGVTEVDSEILRNYIGKEIDLDKFMESETASTSDAYTYLSLDRDNMLRKTSTSKTNVIGNIAVNTSVEMLKTKLAEIGINISAITIYNRKGEAVSDNTAIVGTGWRIEIGGEVTYLSVLGDLTGDGRITAADISYLRAIAASDTTNVQDCILLSAILLNKGGITTADSEVLKLVINNKINIDKY